jgi:hypothetical protein
MTKFSLSGLLLIIVLCGCASDGPMREAFGREPVIRYNRLNVASFTGRMQRFPTPPQRPYGTVKVFENRDDVKQAYEIIGMMSCEGEAKEEAEIIRAMLYRAADMGSDGIILNPASSASQPNGAGNIDVRVNKDRGFRAQAIKFKPEEQKAVSQ